MEKLSHEQTCILDHIHDLSQILDVFHKQELLRNEMAPEDLQLCLDCETNELAVQRLCVRMTQTGNTPLFQVLTDWFHNQQEKYGKFHEDFKNALECQVVGVNEGVRVGNFIFATLISQI